MRSPHFTVTWVIALSFLAATARAVTIGPEINPQEIALVMDNFLVDLDATTIGLLDHQNGGTHGLTTFTNRAVYSGQPTNALPTEPLATRVEWEVWHSTTKASISGDDYVIDYKGFMRDTRVVPTDPATYDIRWESQWYKNDPLKTATFAEGDGGWKYVDPELSFDISIDPLNPSAVTVSGSASATLWGVVDLEISGEKDFGTKILTAKAGASVSVPLVSDVLDFFGLESKVASGAFVFEYDQETGDYESRMEGQILFDLFSGQTTVNGGSIRAPALIEPPMTSKGPMELEPPFTHTIDGKWVITPHGVNVPNPAPPFIGGSGATHFTDSLNPFGDLAQEIAGLQPTGVFNIPQTLFSHPGFIDPMSHPFDSSIPTVAYSFQDPTIGFPTTGGPPPGITLSPIQNLSIDVPEPNVVLLISAAASTLLVRRRRALDAKPAQTLQRS